MPDNIFTQGPAATAESSPANPPAVVVQQTSAAPSHPGPSTIKRSFRLPLNGIVGLAVVVVLTLGTFGVALPTDQWFHSVGQWVVETSGNSLITLGYALSLAVVASVVVGSALGRRSK